MADTSLAGMSTKDRLILRGQAEAWIPEPGDFLGGIVFGTTTGSGDYGEYPILFVYSDDDKPVTVHAFHTTLKNAVRGAVSGDRLDLLFVERVKSKVSGHSDIYIYQGEVTKMNGSNVSVPVIPDEKPF